MIEQSELDEFDLSVPPAKQTRWDAVPLTTGPATNGSAPTGSAPMAWSDAEPDDEKKERGGIFLAGTCRPSAPVIFVAAFVLSDTDGSSDLEQGIATPTSTGLDSVGIAEDGAPELNEGLTPTTPSAASSLVDRATPTTRPTLRRVHRADRSPCRPIRSRPKWPERPRRRLRHGRTHR